MNQVVFIEIKTGKSQLNKNEAMISSAIEKGRVKRETIRI
jgi:predicted Holliday junction resolvase-like endonuclease